MAKKTKVDVAEATGVPVKTLNKILAYIVDEVAAGNTVQFTGAFSVKPVLSKPREVHVPSTGDRMTTQAKYIPRFAAGSDWKRVVAEARQPTS